MTLGMKVTGHLSMTLDGCTSGAISSSRGGGYQADALPTISSPVACVSITQDSTTGKAACEAAREARTVRVVHNRA